MLTPEALTGAGASAPFVGCADLAASRFLDRRPTLGLALLEPWIAALASALTRRSQTDVAALEELDVMCAPLAYGCAENWPTGVSDNALGFLGMAFLLTAVVAALCFCGRATGLSGAARTLPSTCAPLSRSPFFPGS